MISLKFYILITDSEWNPSQRKYRKREFRQNFRILPFIYQNLADDFSNNRYPKLPELGSREKFELS